MNSGNLRSCMGLALAGLSFAAQANYSSFIEKFQPAAPGSADDVPTTAPALTGVSFPNFYYPGSRYWNGNLPAPGGDPTTPVWGHGSGTEKLTDEAGNQFIRLTSDTNYGQDAVYVTLSLNAGYYDFSFSYRAVALNSLQFSLERTSAVPPAPSFATFSTFLGNQANWTGYTSPPALTSLYLVEGTYKLAWEDVKPNDGQFVDIDNISFKSISAVPEPQTYAMLLMGLGVLGFVAMRKRDQAGALPSVKRPHLYVR